jgi:hypothetical protein
MRLFSRENSSKRSDRAHDNNVNERLRLVLSREIEREDADIVEGRIRNLNYGSSRK